MVTLLGSPRNTASSSLGSAMPRNSLRAIGQHEVPDGRSGQRGQDQPVHGAVQDVLGVIEPAEDGGRLGQGKLGFEALSVVEGAAQFGGRPDRGPQQGRDQPDRQA